MKFSIFIFSIFVSAFFVSCNDDDGPESSIVEVNTTTVEAAINAPISFPAGTIIYINPEIKLLSDLTEGSTATAEYTNTQSDSRFPAASETITLNFKKTAKEVMLFFTTSSGQNVEIAISAFTDLGSDGYFDEFTLEAKVDGKKVIVSTGLGRFGRFVGNTKPRNNYVANAKKLDRAPTEEEFDSLIFESFGMYYIIDSTAEAEVATLKLDQAGTGTLEFSNKNVGHTGDDETGHIHNIRWRYLYNSGSPTLEIKTKEDDLHYRKFGLTFVNFYEGTLTVDEGFNSGINFSKVETGSFRFFNGISYYYKHP